jgi:MFS family permease
MEVKKTAVGALVAAEIVSILGTRMTYLALPWFVLVTTGSPTKMTLVLAVEIVPMVLFGIPSGTLVQRLGSRTTMLVADFARAPLMAAVPVLYALDVLSFPLLLAVVFALGSFMPPYFASQRTILPELVGEDERAMSQANSMIEGGSAFAALAGPALAGLLIPFIGATNVLYVDAATFVVSFALILFFVPRRKAVTALPDDADRGVLAGLRFAMRDSLIRPLGLTVVAAGFLTAGLSAALPYYAFDEFGSPRIAALFSVALGSGALVGSVLAMVAVKRVRPLRLAGLAVLAFAAPLWILPLEPPVAVFFVALFTATLFTPFVNGPILALITARTPEHLRAKTMTALVSVNTVASPAGFVVAGQMLERWGVVAVFAATAVGMSIMALAFAAIALRHRDEDVPVAEAAIAG